MVNCLINLTATVSLSVDEDEYSSELTFVGA